jgi:hypothetical protein
MIREALVVGINNHTFHKDFNLKAPVKDAEAIAQMLEKYGKFHVQRLPKDYDETGRERFISNGKVKSKDLKQKLVIYLILYQKMKFLMWLYSSLLATVR